MATTIYVKDKNNNTVYSVNVDADPPSAEYNLQAGRMRVCAEHQNKFSPADPYYVTDSAGRTLFPKACPNVAARCP